MHCSTDRVVPNRSFERRPSSSMAGRRPSHFFKIILPSTMDDKKLRIPEKFVREFGDELSDVATLTVPNNGHFWQVGLEKANKEIWFQNGWQDFMESHSILYGYFLVFRYEGSSKFHVLVFDNTATEIQYTWSKKRKLEDKVDIMESDDAKRSRRDKLKENEMSNSDELSGGKHEENRAMVSRGRERAVQAAKMLKPTSPSFMSILPCHIREQRRLYVPVRFAKKHLIGRPFVSLQTCDGKQWHARPKLLRYDWILWVPVIATE
ncbi:B3 domain-containing protein At4g01580-like [Alnus glutinosa]|uniref:B3 domain-containing protein At4g01580-like n=1 Tax=Alnus glutinosa TaxID=3517 RepID=UPI002D784E80|nr:B3 domain-containing protein At4g01580-like [Alnus glutinosa]